MGSEIFLTSPILAIAILSVIAIISDAANEDNKTLGFIIALFSVTLTGVLSLLTLYMDSNGMVVIEDMSNLFTANTITFGGIAAFFDVLFCIGALFTIITARSYLREEKTELNEFYNLVLYSLAGMMIIVHSNHMLTLFIGIEIMSLSFYILSGYFRHTTKSVEAALKYFLLGAFSTGFLVYGMAMIYGATGSMYFQEITAVIAGGSAQPAYMLFGVGLLIIGLSFKASAFPFHQWAPDVYTGSPTIVASFMSTAGKAAALSAFIVIGRTIMPAAVDVEAIRESLDIEKVKTVLAVVSGATMLIGNITALVQNNVKRMLAYSSVAHAGYMLMGIVVNTPEAWSAIMYYATVYLFMQIGAFVVLSILERNTDKNLMFDDYSGLSKHFPYLAAMMAIFMFSLAGIPPFGGFFGKYFIFKAAIGAGYIWLTIVAVISSIISIYFYIGLVVYMYFKESAGSNELSDANFMSSKAIIAISGVIILLMGLTPNGILSLLQNTL